MAAGLEQSGASGGDGMIPQKRLRIKLKSYNVPAIQESVQTILDAASSTGAKVSGPVYLPTRIRKYTVLSSPHVNKKAREQFEIRTHSRLMDVTNLSGPTVESLMRLKLPAGVDVKVTL
ncbi:hypothetical protein WJX73_008978 [Symbiochloris irregularis]|uniref:Small ribosomal subunit protein uS10 domain-containing protein n=1 Tax=Symbiochloris irregularis TaxID=706552 RepID=A0AAW1PIX8_9CHLO